MSRYFVNDPPVAVPEFDAGAVLSDTPPNVIYIKAKMDMATDARVKSELVTLAGDNKTVEMHLGANQVALLVHNIVRWEGPDLTSVPCDEAHIRALDPTEPHIALVLDEITRRNARKVAPNPKAPAEPGSKTNGLHDVNHQSEAEIFLPSEISISKSPLLRALDGRRDRSES